MTQPCQSQEQIKHKPNVLASKYYEPDQLNNSTLMELMKPMKEEGRGYEVKEERREEDRKRIPQFTKCPSSSIPA